MICIRTLVVLAIAMIMPMESLARGRGATMGKRGGKVGKYGGKLGKQGRNVGKRGSDFGKRGGNVGKSGGKAGNSGGKAGKSGGKAGKSNPSRTSDDVPGSPPGEAGQEQGGRARSTHRRSSAAAAAKHPNAHQNPSRATQKRMTVAEYRAMRRSELAAHRSTSKTNASLKTSPRKRK